MGDGDNTVVSGSGNDLVTAGTGDDVVVLGPGDDTFEGGIEVTGGLSNWYTQLPNQTAIIFYLSSMSITTYRATAIPILSLTTA